MLKLHWCVIQLCNSNRVAFIERIVTIWNTLLPYVRHYDDGLSAAFGVLPYWSLSQVVNLVCVTEKSMADILI